MTGIYKIITHHCNSDQHLLFSSQIYDMKNKVFYKSNRSPNL